MTEKQNTVEKDWAKKTVGEYVSEDYRAAGVFEKHGIDFCCGGAVPLAEACREKGLDTAAVVREIMEVKKEPIRRSEDYRAWTLSFLSDYIVNTHHAWLYENTGQIAAYTRKIAEVHGERHPELSEVADLFDRMVADMMNHLREEEEVLFPAIRRAETAAKAGREPEGEDRATIRTALATLHNDHDEIGEATHRIRHLSSDYAVPEDACNTYALAYRMLQEFEDDLHKHVHLENNILFPGVARL